MAESKDTKKPTQAKVPKPSKTVDQVAPPVRGLMLAWEAPEFKQFRRDYRWLVGIIVFVLILGGLFVWQKNYSALLVTIAGAFVFYTYGTREPRTIRYVIDEQGFHRGDQLIPWDDLKSYWINQNEDDRNLYLETTARLINFEKIYLENVGITDLQRIFSNRLPQNRTRTEEFFDNLSRIIKF